MAGEIVGLIGPNGAGKTTSLNLISGFMNVDTGRVAFSGADLAGLRRTASRRWAWSAPSSTPNLSASDGDRERDGRYSPRPAPSVIGSLFRSAGFRKAEEERRDLALPHWRWWARKLPGPDLRRSALRRAAIACDRLGPPPSPECSFSTNRGGPQPYRGDAVGRSAPTPQGAKVTIVLVEHNLELVMSVCDRIVVLHHGEVVTIGSARDVRQNETVRSAYLGYAVEPSRRTSMLEVRGCGSATAISRLCATSAFGVDGGESLRLSERTGRESRPR